jgi:hypothetical protein
VTGIGWNATIGYFRPLLDIIAKSDVSRNFPQISTFVCGRHPTLAIVCQLLPGTTVLPLYGIAAILFTGSQVRYAPMLRERQFTVSPEDVADSFAGEPLDIRGIIRKCIELPPDVSSAEFTRVDERLLDRQLLSILGSESAAESDEANRAVRQQCRDGALSPYLDKTLICVFIRLPGIHYTIEIDAESERVVHWEWQTT